MFRFDGRVVLLTGASRGIGLATAKLLIKQGAKVMAVARTESDLKKAKIFEHYYVADVSSQKSCQDLVDYTIQTLGKIDVLVCNHGIGSAAEKPIQETSIEEWKSNMSINLDGPFYLTRFVLPGMIQQNYGRCVYTSSTAATAPETSAPAYNTSKTGLLGIVGSVCQDGGPHNITANAVLPGWVKTEMADKSAAAEASERGNVTADDVWKERAELYPPKRVVTPEEVANTILFLASEESSGISGEAIRISLGCPW